MCLRKILPVLGLRAQLPEPFKHRSGFFLGKGEMRDSYACSVKKELGCVRGCEDVVS